MKPVNNDTVIKQLNWRYATKKFDPSRKISEEDWKTLEQTLVLAPSSYGLQPWKFIVVKDPATREKLVAASWNQRQIVDASHLVVFAIRKDLGGDDVERYVDRVAEVRGAPREALEQYRQMMRSHVNRHGDGFDINEWSARQLYIALGSYMTVAAMLGIDTCPMEGINPKQYDQILGLEKQGLATLCACPAGYRAADCKSASLPKVRFKAEDVIARV
jgi:nitroreductase